MNHNLIEKEFALTANKAQIILGSPHFRGNLQLTHEQLKLCSEHAISIDIVQRNGKIPLTEGSDKTHDSNLLLEFKFSDKSRLVHKLSNSFENSGDDDLPF